MSGQVSFCGVGGRGGDNAIFIIYLITQNYFYFKYVRTKLKLAVYLSQAEAMETDGFQADTEDEDDDDCIILCEQSGKCKPSTTNSC